MPVVLAREARRSDAVGRRRRVRPAVALVWALVTVPVFGADWFDAYEKGVQALARRDAPQAVKHLEAAVQDRPEPGTNILTYGTNRIGRYYPYLRLAEAHLLAGSLEKALAVLEVSDSFHREPAAERASLRAKIESATLAVAAARPSPAPPVEPARSTLPPARSPALSPLPDAAPTPSPTSNSMPPASATAALVEAPATKPRVSAGDEDVRSLPSGRAPAETPQPEPIATTSPALVAGLEVFTSPAGADVYLDDEAIGRTDSASGRLVKSGVSPGRHLIRAGQGPFEARAEVDVKARGTTTVRLELARASSTPIVAGLVVLATGLGALALWLRRRRRATLVRASSAQDLATTASPLVTPRERTLAEETQALPTPPSGAGESFGEFRLTGLLGKGGMALVYRAERRGEVLALKRPLNALLDDGEFLERFLREAEIGRTLHHPNIVRIHERGEVAGVPFFTMELVTGETLQAALRRGGALEPRYAATVVAQVAEALDYAHLKGVVHRDLKPSNVMLDASGIVRVMDYGIARARRFEGLTLTGSFLGTPDYAAPETVVGGVADSRSDLYSLGVILYECLTGQKLFPGDTPFAILRRHCDDEPLPPSLITPGIPERLEDIVLRLLNKKPADRHPDAEALLLDLRDFLNRAA